MGRLHRHRRSREALRGWQRPLRHLSVIPLASMVVLLSTLAAGAAASTHTTVCDQCEEPDRFVRLQPASEEARPVSSQPFTHPLVLSPEQWTSILTGLHVRRQAEGFLFGSPAGPIGPAFTAEEIDYLSTTLSQAFARAQPEDWVVFGLSRSTPYGMTDVTTGGWFVEGPSLHVVLANYRKVATMPNTRRLLWELPLRPDAGPAYDLVAGPHQTAVRESSVRSSLLAAAPSELRIAYQAALLEAPAQAPASQDTPAHPPQSVPPHKSLEDRLRLLQRLHTDGLITDEDYRIQKQRLLEQFLGRSD